MTKDKKLERRRQLLLTYHASAIETYSNVEKIILDVSRARQTGYNTDPRDINDPYAHVSALVYAGLCDSISCFRAAHERYQKNVFYKMSGWEKLALLHAARYSRESKVSAKKLGMRDAVGTIEHYSRAFHLGIFLEFNDEEMARYEQIKSTPKVTQEICARIEMVNDVVGEDACNSVAELAKAYLLLKDPNRVIEAARIWQHARNEDTEYRRFSAHAVRLIATQHL